MELTKECRMAEVLLSGWSEFSLSTEQFHQIVSDFMESMEAGLSGADSPLQMLPAFVGRPRGEEKGKFLSLDFGGTNVRVAKVELDGAGGVNVSRIHKVSLKNPAEGYDYTCSAAQATDLFGFLARQLSMLSEGNEIFLGHSFSFASHQSSLGQATFSGWTKEIRVSGMEDKDINGLLSEALIRQGVACIRPVAVINDTTATLLAAAYSRSEADMGSVCGTGHNTCYYEAIGQGGGVMAHNAESGGFDRLPFTIFDNQLDKDSELPGRQRLEKMVAGRYLGELTRRILWEGRDQCGFQLAEHCKALQKTDALSSVDVAVFLGDKTKDLEEIGRWMDRQAPDYRSNLPERLFVKEVSTIVVKRAASLAAATYTGFLNRMDARRQHRHVIGVNGSLYEKMPGFAEAISLQLAVNGGWGPEKVGFAVVDEAPLVGAAIAAAMATAKGTVD